jgi:glycosyltransferase involved in cell wall biosynthesis
MKIAYFSPFPPKMTGIAVYSEQLVRELRKMIQVDCYDYANEQAGNPSVTFSDFARTGRISDLANYDAIIYHLGNNPHCHLDIFQIMCQFKGIVVLHDVVLYYLLAGLGRAGLIKHLWLNYGRKGVAEINQIVADCPNGEILRYEHPENHALTASVFPHASRIIVHNDEARERVISLGYPGTVHTIPHASFPSTDTAVSARALNALRRKHSVATDDLVIGCVGFIGRTKRIDQVCRALSLLRSKLQFRFLLVGEGDTITKVIEETGLSQLTIRTGFVDQRDFSCYLGFTDIFVNLRYPSMGESSGTLTRAMALGKACIVTKDSWFAGLPDDAVIKIEIGENEVRDLAAAITKLAGSTELRESLGQSARRFTEETLNPSAVARAFQKVIETDVKERAQESMVANAQALDSTETAVQILRDSLMWRLPGHLKRPFWKPYYGSGAQTGPSEDEVRWAYRILLNREPENEEVIEQVRSVVNDVADLRNLIMQSEEFRQKNVASDSGNFLAAKLQRAQRSVLPPDFAWGWHGLESAAEENWRWSSGDAKIVLYNSSSIEKGVRLAFGLGTVKPRSIKITLRGQRVHQTSLRPGRPRRVEMVLTLVPGANELRFATDVPTDPPSDNDPRKLAFMLRDLNISEQRRGNLGNTGEKSGHFPEQAMQMWLDST